MNEQLERACALLRERIGEEIRDVQVRDAVCLLLDAHENAKHVVSVLRDQLARTYEMLDRVTKHPEFKRMMEAKDDGEEKRGDGPQVQG